MKRTKFINRDAQTPGTKKASIQDSEGCKQDNTRHPLAYVNKQFQSPLPYEHKTPSRGTLGPRKQLFNLKQLGLGNLGIPLVITKQVRGEEPGELILFDPTPEQQQLSLEKHGKEYQKVAADDFLCKRLRPHQRDGIKFLFECCSGLKKDGFYGCILSDGMGLGKTFQSIALLWTLLNQGVYGEATCCKSLILCPASLVANWGKEVIKWLEGRIEPTIVDDTRADQVKAQIMMFGGVGYMKNKKEVLVMSYSTFRNHKDALYKKTIDFLICDEAHQLKNKDSQVTLAVQGIPTRRRLLLSGTPIQNDLLEFYAMVNVANPDLLGDSQTFHKYYENPILQGREPYATDSETLLAEQRSVQLVDTCNQFMLRRTNHILKNYLPQKVEQVVFCRLSALQLKLYSYQNNSTAVAQAVFKAENEDKEKETIKLSNRGNNLAPLAAITALKKLCAHPDLIYEMQVGPVLNMLSKDRRKSTRDSTYSSKNASSIQSQAVGKALTGFEGCSETFFDSDIQPTYQPGSCQVVHSGKVYVLQQFLRAIRQTDSTDKTVIVSNYTETLDLLQKVCKNNGWVCLRLDGSCSIKSRQLLVDQFNMPTHPSCVFLLSSKAGGTGLNIIGANRLILFDPDWNPANDQQAMARVWREGQRKDVWIYRFLGTGTLEEKIYQRQIAKEGLSQAVVDDQKGNRHFSRDDLRQLFKLDTVTACDTHKQLRCKCKCTISEDLKPSPQTPPFNQQQDPHLQQQHSNNNSKLSSKSIDDYKKHKIKSIDNNKKSGTLKTSRQQQQDLSDLSSQPSNDNFSNDLSHRSKGGSQNVDEQEDLEIDGVIDVEQQQQIQQQQILEQQQKSGKGIMQWAHLDDYTQSPDKVWQKVQDSITKSLVSFVFSDHNLQDQATDPLKPDIIDTNGGKDEITKLKDSKQKYNMSYGNNVDNNNNSSNNRSSYNNNYNNIHGDNNGESSVSRSKQDASYVQSYVKCTPQEIDDDEDNYEQQQDSDNYNYDSDYKENGHDDD